MGKNKSLDEKDLDKIFGGKGLNSEYTVKSTFIGHKSSYEQILNLVDRLDNSGKLDYLKRK